MGQVRQVRSIEDPAQLEEMLGQLAAQKSQVPPEFAKIVDLLEREARQRLDELQAAAKEEEP